MNAWSRFSRLVFKLLVIVSLFLVGAWVGSAKVAFNWELSAIIAIVATVLITIVWFIGRNSAYEYETEGTEK